MNEISKLPQRIKELRTREKMTQGEFAKKLGLTPATVSAYENEEHTKTPSLKVLINMAGTFNVSLDWLCGIDKKKTNGCSTYREAIESLLALGNSFYMQVKTYAHEAESDHVNSPILTSEFSIDDHLLYEFFDAWKKIYFIFRDGTIDYSLYSLWIERALENPEYTNAPPFYIAHPSIDNSDDTLF